MRGKSELPERRRTAVSGLLFFSSKFSFLAVCLLAAVRFVWRVQCPFLIGVSPSWMMPIVLIFLLFGLLLWLGGLLTQGRRISPYINKQAGQLYTYGVYAISRHPIYTGAALITFAAAQYVFSLVAFLLLAYAVIVQHRIILSEEQFLSSVYGVGYEKYMRRVHRYLGCARKCAALL